MCEIKILAILSIFLLNFLSLSNSSSLHRPPELSFHNLPDNGYATTPFLPSVEDDNCLNTCSNTEGSEPTIIKYKENEVYKYKLEGLTSIHLPNTLKEESTKLTYTASFDIASENKCSFLLRINHVEVIAPDGKRYPDNSLIGYVAKFSWINGRMEKLCLDKKESTISANFKRSILANLQVSSWGNPISRSIPADGATSYETDIYGRCPVSLETMQEPDGSWIVKKSKDLNQCLYRQGFDFAMKTESFPSDGSYKSNPFVDADLRAVIKVEKGIIKSTEINEEYMYQPLSKYGDSQTSVVVTTRISHIGRSKSPISLDTFTPKPASLLYETVKSYDNDATVATLIKAIQDASHEEEADVVPPNAAQTFSHFVSIMQEVNKDKLLTTYAQVNSGAGFKNKQTAIKIFWGGLLSAATPATTETAATLLMSGQMPEDKISEFLASLAFVKHPTEQTLSTLSSLLDGPNVYVDRYLAIGSLIRRYIADNPFSKSLELANLLEKLSAPIKTQNVARTAEEQDLVISSLKGLRNAQYLTPEVAALVRSCASNREISNRVRIAALQTLVVNSSDEMNKKLALALFKMKEETSEIRIGAFLLYADTPTPETALTIKNLLDEEQSDQVGSYMVSYLRNLRTTTDPRKEAKKHFYGNIKSKNKHPVDFRQFSQNYHLSHLFPSVGSGYSGDLDVVFSSESYVPRSTHLNLDTYLFDNSFNLFEFDARFENVEFLLEKYLGPRSYLRTNKAEDIADDVSEMAKKLAGEMAQKASLLGRQKREIQSLEDTVAQLKMKTPLVDKYMDIDLSLRVFESEIFWTMYHTEKNEVASGEYLDRLFDKIAETIESAKKINVDYKRYARNPILSNNLIYYPTSSGFSLKIAINAHSAVNFKMNGTVDAAKILSSPKTADVRLLVLPSAVVEVEAALEIDASVISAGLKISSTVRSATGLEIDFKVLDGHGYDLKVGLPIKEQDVLSVRTQAFSTMRERSLPPVEVPLQPSGKRYTYENNFSQLAELIGLSLETKIDFPSVGYRPTLGTSEFSVRLVKADELLKHYKMRIFYNNKEQNYRSIEFLVDTPGSTINRQLSFFADVNSNMKKITAKIVAGKKELNLEAFGKIQNDEVFCYGNLRNDGLEYSVKLGAVVTTEKYRTTYRPYLELTSPYDAREATLDKHRLTPKESAQPLNIDGLVVLDRKKNSKSYRLYDFQQLALLSPLGKFAINGRVLYDSEYPRFGSDLVLTYGGENTIMLRSNLNYSKNLPDEKQMSAAIAILASQWPAYGFQYTLNYNKTPNAYARTMTLTTGPDLNSDISKLTIKEILNTVKHPESDKIRSVDGSIFISYPLWKTSIDLEVKETNYNFFSGAGKLILDKNNIILNGSVSLENTKPGTIDVNLQTEMNNKHLSLHGVRELIDEETSKITVNVNTNPGKQLLIAMNVKHRLKPDNYVLRANSVISVQPDNRIYKQDIGFVYSSMEKKFHAIFSPNNVRNLEISAGYTNSPSSMDANGVFYILNNIDGTASLKVEQEKINGNLRLEIVKMRRLITGDLQVNVHDGNHYTGFGELLWDASKDKTKIIRIDSNTLISEDKRDIISENDIQVMNYRFQLNGNLSIDGDMTNNAVQMHVQLVLSNGTSVGVNISRVYHVEESVHNYNLHVNGYYIPEEQSEQIELVFVTNAKDLDLTNYLFDLNTDFTLDLPNSRNLRHGFKVKRTLANSQWSIGGNVYVDGTIVKKQLKLAVESEYSDLVNDYGLLSRERSLPPTTFNLHGHVGDDYVFDSTTKIEKGELKNVLNLRIPVQNKSFDLRWLTSTKVDIIPSKHVSLETSNSVTWNGDNEANWIGTFEVFPKNGKFSLSWNSSNAADRSVEVLYAFDDTQEDGLKGPFCRANVNFTFDGKVASFGGKIEFSKDLSTRLITIVGQSPKNGSFDIRASSKVQDFGQNVFQDISFTSNGKQWHASSLIATYPTKPMIDLFYSSPEADSRFMIKFEERIHNYWTGAINVSLMHGVAGYVKLAGELKLDTVDDILIKVDLDSPSFGVNNFSLLANNKANEGGKKRITFTTRMDDEPLYSGSTSYIYHADNHRLTFEGSGTVRIDDKNHPFTFKYYKVQLTESTSGETGSASKFYISLDNKKYALDLEGKFTDKSFMVKRDLWKEDKCFKMDLSYQIKMIDVLNFEKSLLIHIDLKPHIPNGEEFVIEGKTIRSASNYDQRLSLQWAPEKKVDFNMHSIPGKSGITLTLPKRQLAAEITYIYEFGTDNGNVKFESSVWFDKTRNENQKLLLSSGTEFKIPENHNTFVLRSTADLQIPTLPKSLSVDTNLILSLQNQKSIDFKTELDVFKKREQMITVTYQVFKGKKGDGYSIWSSLKAESDGQNMKTELRRSIEFYLDHMDYELILSYKNYKGVEKKAMLDMQFRPFSVTGHLSYDNITLGAKSEIGIGTNYIEIREEFNIFGHEYGKSVKLTFDPRVVISLQWKGSVQQTAVLDTSLQWKNALNVTLNLSGYGEVAKFKLYLGSERFMNTETEFFIDNAKILLDNGKKDLLLLIDDAKKSTKSAMNEAVAHYAYRSRQYREANIDMKPVIESSNAYLTELRNEIKSDPSIISASQNVKKIINGVVDFVFVILQQLSAFLGDWIHGYDVLMEKLNEFMEELSENINKLMQLSMDDVSLWVRDAINQLWKHVLKAIEYMKANKTKWKEALISVSDSVKDSYRVAFETFEQFKKDAQEFYERLLVYVTSMPLTNYLKDRFTQLKDSQILQYVWSFVREIGENFKEHVTNEEFRTLLDMILSTMDKVINAKPYDLNDEMKGIYKQLMECLRVVAVKVADGFSYVRDVTDTSDYSMPQFSLSYFKNLPNIWSSSTSFMLWIREIDLPSANEFLETFEFGSVNMLELIPPFKKVGLLLDGQHVVTMNGHHYTLTTDCRYLLAADFRDLNFTIISTLKNGKLAALTISSGQQTIELYPEGMPALNKVRTDYPVYGQGLYAIRNPTSIDIYVDNSVYISTSLSLNICIIQISGFYYGRVFGLLGSTTSESYLDLTMPDMTIAKDLPSFAKSYQASKKCKAPTQPATTDLPRSSECAYIFNGKSVFRRGYSFVNINPYREMCEEMVAKESTPAHKVDAACKVGLAFSLVSYMKGYYITLPTQCSKCTMKGKTLPYGNSDTVNIPTSSVEIFVLLDKSNFSRILYREMFSKAMISLRNSLEKQNIRDVKFILVSYGEDDARPSLHTTNGEVILNEDTKITFLNGERKEPSTELGKVVRDLKYFLGLYDARRALEMVNEYPVRPEAVRSIVQLDSEDDRATFDKYDIFNTIIRAMISWNIVNNKISVFLLTPKESISVDADDSVDEIFGFDMNSIFTINGPEPFKDGIMSRLHLLQIYGGSAVLPISTNGAVFNSSVFVNGETTARSRLINVFTNRIADGLGNVVRNVECVCKNKWGVHSELRCTVLSVTNNQ